MQYVRVLIGGQKRKRQEWYWAIFTNNLESSFGDFFGGLKIRPVVDLKVKVEDSTFEGIPLNVPFEAELCKLKNGN